jgi:hypothetical protein
VAITSASMTLSTCHLAGGQVSAVTVYHILNLLVIM